MNPEYAIFSEIGEVIDRGFETEREAFEAMCDQVDVNDFSYVGKVCRHGNEVDDCEMCEEGEP